MRGTPTRAAMGVNTSKSSDDSLHSVVVNGDFSVRSNSRSGSPAAGLASIRAPPAATGRPTAQPTSGRPSHKEEFDRWGMHIEANKELTYRRKLRNLEPPKAPWQRRLAMWIHLNLFNR